MNIDTSAPASGSPARTPVSPPPASPVVAALAVLDAAMTRSRSLDKAVDAADPSPVFQVLDLDATTPFRPSLDKIVETPAQDTAKSA